MSIGSHRADGALVNGFDLLVADIAMPDLDGYDLIEQVRRLGDGRGRIPAIAVTAYARREDRDRALAAGYDGYCPKPLDTAEFSRVIAEVLQSPQATGCQRRRHIVCSATGMALEQPQTHTRPLAIVTGASSGIGYELAKLCAATWIRSHPRGR